MKPVKILYFHGFTSSANSQKSIKIQKMLAEQGQGALATVLDRKLSFEALTYPQVKVSQSINFLKIWLEKQSKDYNLVLIGSSLGGYYVEYFGQKLKLPYCMLNPALNVSLFDEHKGEHINPTTKEAVTVDEEYIQSLRNLQHKTLDEEIPALLLMDEKDEVIDIEFALKRYRPVKNISNFHSKIFAGGSHDFEHLFEATDALNHWLKKCELFFKHL